LDPASPVTTIQGMRLSRAGPARSQWGTGRPRPLSRSSRSLASPPCFQVSVGPQLWVPTFMNGNSVHPRANGVGTTCECSLNEHSGRESPPPTDHATTQDAEPKPRAVLLRRKGKTVSAETKIDTEKKDSPGRSPDYDLTASPWIGLHYMCESVGTRLEPVL